MNNIIKIILVLVISLGLFGSAHALTFANVPDVTFAEDGSNSTLDLDNYVSAVNGTVSFTYSGANKVKVSIDATTHIVTFTAESDWNGQETITFNATDASETKSDIIIVTVTAVNDAPVLVLPLTLQLTEGIAFSYDVNATDVDVADTKTFSAAPIIPWANFKMDGNNGKISFTPTAVDIGAHLVDITAKDAAGASDTKTFRFFVTDSCTTSSVLFSSVEVEDVTGENDELLPGDYLQAEFDLKNNLPDDLSDVKIKAWIEDLANADRFSARVESSKTAIDSKDSKSLLLKLRLYLTAKKTIDIKNTLVLYMRAEGEDENGTTRCAWYQKDLTVERNRHNLLIENVDFIPSEAVCGGSISASALVWNIGSTNENDVKLRFRNSALGIDQTTSTFELDSSGSGAKATKSLSLDIPSTAKASTYPIEVIASFNNGEDSTSAIKDLNISCEASTTITGAAVAEGKATIAVSQSSATASKEQTVKYTITLTNTENQAVNYKLSLTGITDWASGLVEPEDITLAPGASIPVYVYVTPKSDTTGGEHTATVTIKSGATVLDSKTLTTNVQAPTTTITEFGSGRAVVKPISLSSVDRDSVLFAVLFIVVVVFAGLLTVRQKAKEAVKVEVYGVKKGRKGRA